LQCDSALVDNIPLMICLTDYDGHIIDTNRYFASAVGLSKEELKGSLIFSIVKQTNGLLRDTVALCSSQGQVKEIEVGVHRKDGFEFSGILAASALHRAASGYKEKASNNNDSDDDDRHRIGASGVIGIAIAESSNLTLANKKMEAINEELRMKESLKNEFIAIASHELRTPIQPILGLALLAKKGQISQEEAWDSVLKEARRLTQLANDILDVSRIENGMLRYNFAKANVAEIIEYVLNSLKSSEQAKDIHFSTVIDDDSRKTYCEIDRQRITQVLINVIGNAVKFTKKGTVTVEAKVDVKNARYDIMVSDTGGGVPEAILPNMFKKFITKSVGEEERHGSGLGLFISRAIVTSHGGAIYLYNNEKGATFVIRLPIEQKKVTSSGMI
jgi:PAS domain S-box-containing protein